MNETKLISLVLFVIFSLGVNAFAQNLTVGETQMAQFGFIKEKLLPKLSSSTRSLFDEQSISTNLSDAYPEFPIVNEIYVVKNEAPLSMDLLPVDEKGSMILKPGYYYKDVKTY